MISIVVAVSSASIQAGLTSVYNTLPAAYSAPRFCIDREPSAIIGVGASISYAVNIISLLAFMSFFIVMNQFGKTFGEAKGLFVLDILAISSSVLPLVYILQVIHFAVDDPFKRCLYILLTIFATVGSIETPLFCLIYAVLYPERSFTLLEVFTIFFLRFLSLAYFGFGHLFWAMDNFVFLESKLKNHDIEALAEVEEVQALPFSYFSKAVARLCEEQRFDEVDVLIDHPKVSWYDTCKLAELPIFNEKLLFNPKYLQFALGRFDRADLPPDSHQVLRDLLDGREKYLILANCDQLTKDVSLYIASMLVFSGYFLK